MKKLKRLFYVANLHFNNYNSCSTRLSPFPAWAYEVLFVSKRLRIPDTSAAPVFHAANAPNNPGHPDCQVADRSSGPPNAGAANQ